MEEEAHVPWNKQQWNKTKATVKEIENDYTMENKEIQNKILEILQNKNKE